MLSVWLSEAVEFRLRAGEEGEEAGGEYALVWLGDGADTCVSMTSKGIL
jgi:hypothetical protein